jgi:hypothetical protein
LEPGAGGEPLLPTEQLMAVVGEEAKRGGSSGRQP